MAYGPTFEPPNALWPPPVTVTRTLALRFAPRNRSVDVALPGAVIVTVPGANVGVPGGLPKTVPPRVNVTGVPDGGVSM